MSDRDHDPDRDGVTPWAARIPPTRPTRPEPAPPSPTSAEPCPSGGVCRYHCTFECRRAGGRD